VSLYKEIDAISGAVLLGTRDFVAEAAVWQRRHGGTLVRQLPAIVTAAMQIERQLEQMPRWHAHARALVAAIRDLPGVRVLPDPPHTSMFHVMVDVPADRIEGARDRVARDHAIWLLDRPRPCDVPGWSRFEVAIHSSALRITPDELRAAMAALFA
jgi:threonine aldolase